MARSREESQGSKRMVRFNFKAPEGARDVKLCGSFTNWEKGAIRMKNAKSGEWSATVMLDPGEYQYRFLSDGHWYNDPRADKQMHNVFGSQNSVKRIQ